MTNEQFDYLQDRIFALEAHTMVMNMYIAKISDDPEGFIKFSEDTFKNMLNNRPEMPQERKDEALKNFTNITSSSLKTLTAALAYKDKQQS